MLASSPSLHELVDCTNWEPSSGQVLVEWCNAERQKGAFSAASLKPLNALAKLRQNDIAPGIDHALPQDLRCAMFLLCSHVADESIRRRMVLCSHQIHRDFLSGHRAHFT